MLLQLVLSSILLYKSAIGSPSSPSVPSNHQANYHSSDTGRRPILNIAHRGSSGTLPEHTVAAYRRAIEEGADFIECDVVITKDLHLVCLHDSWLGDATNVADMFPPSRKNTRFIVDLNRTITDYFTVDFTLEELNRVRVKQRLKSRSPIYDGKFKVPTLEEYLEVAKEAVDSSKEVGIYPEIKTPRWINSLEMLVTRNVTFEGLILEVLRRYGYVQKSSRCMIQCFDIATLKSLAPQTKLRLVQLLWNDYDVSDHALEVFSSYCYGVGVAKSMIVVPDANNSRVIGTTTDLIGRAHRQGLKVHVYTFKNDDLLWDYLDDPYLEYEKFLNLKADGFFTDFPGTLMRFLDYKYYACSCVDRLRITRPLSWLLAVGSFLAMYFYN